MLRLQTKHILAAFPGSRRYSFSSSGDNVSQAPPSAYPQIFPRHQPGASPEDAEENRSVCFTSYILNIAEDFEQGFKNR